MALQAGDLSMAWQVQWALAERDLFLGEADTALARFMAFGGIKRYHEMNATTAPFLVRVFAALHAAVGRLDDADDLIQLAIRDSGAAQDRLHLVEAYRVYGQIKAAQGHLEEAEPLLTHACDLARRTHYRFGEGRTLQGLGLVFTARDMTDKARSALSEAHTIFAKLGATKNQERVSEALQDLVDGVSCGDEHWRILLARL